MDVELRHGFRPPRYHVQPLGAGDWDAIPPVAVLTDLFGEELPQRDLRLQLAYDDRALHLRVRVTEPKPTVRRDLAPDSPDFWRQDHIEVRFLPDPQRPGEQVQFILAPDGRFWENRGLAQQPARPGSAGELLAGAWKMTLQVPFRAVGLPSPPPAGFVLRGIVAHVRWADGFPDIACLSPVQLGFPQAERFAELVFESSPTPIILAGMQAESPKLGAGENQFTLTLTNGSDQTARVGIEGGARLQLPPGRHQLPITLGLTRPAMRRLVMTAEVAGQKTELGAVTLRAAPRPIAHLREKTDQGREHPYLYFDEAGLAEFGRKMALPVLAPLARDLAPTEADYDESHLPPSSGFVFDFDRDSMNWFRVARESMLRDGEGGRRPSSRRIWELLPAAAQEAFRDIVRTVTATDEQLAVLLPALNALLHRRDFYTREAFGSVGLPAEGHQLLARGIERLGDKELIKLNRILFQSAVECCHKFKVDLAARAAGYLPQWLASRDSRLIHLATRTAQAAADVMIPEAAFHLHEGNCSPGLALSYDTYYPQLSDEERGHWRRLLTLLLDLYLQTARARGWTVTAIPNANPVGNAGGGFLALALWREEPEKAREALYWARKFVWNWLDYCSGPDGGNTEGAQYWSYGTESFLRFALLLERVTGSDEGFLSHPAIQHAMNMVRVGLCNDGALHGVNDTIPSPAGAEVAWAVAARHGDPFALWYGDHALRWFEQRRAEGKSGPYRAAPLWGMLFRPELPEATRQPEPLPTALTLHSIEYGILRSGTNYDCALVAGLKGSRPPYTHHNQRDTGALWVDVRGERLLIDPGYYKEQPTDHCLPLLDGRGPVCPTTWTGRIIACESRDHLRYLAIDSTGAYPGAAQRVVRHLVMMGEIGLILLDDIVAAGEVTTQFQCGGITEDAGDGRAVMIRGRQAALRLELLTRPELRLTLHPERSLHDTHWGYHFADCRLFPVTGKYAADARAPLVATLLDATAGMPDPVDFRADADTIVVQLPGWRPMLFRRRETGWELAV